MKKMIILLMLGSMLLVGCSSKEEEKAKAKNLLCKLSYTSSQIEEEVEIEVDSDGVITKIIKRKEAALADYLFERNSVEELEQLYKDDYINPNREQKGLTFDISVNEQEKKLVVVIEIDPKEVSQLDMNDLGLKEYTDSSKLENLLKSEGYSCEEME